MGSMAVLTHTDSLVQELQSLPLKVDGGAGDTKIASGAKASPPSL
jgi:hypothetical protein